MPLDALTGVTPSPAVSPDPAVQFVRVEWVDGASTVFATSGGVSASDVALTIGDAHLPVVHVTRWEMSRTGSEWPDVGRVRCGPVPQDDPTAPVAVTVATFDRPAESRVVEAGNPVSVRRAFVQIGAEFVPIGRVRWVRAAPA
jgi:hypothetical protein